VKKQEVCFRGRTHPKSLRFDVVIVGGGHAGCEAAHAAARMGCKTALLSMNPSRIGFMSCNPAIGGLAKGQLVKEIDALGGVMGMNTDKTAIQYRRLNSSKGPAVRSSRAQCDKELYALRMQEYLATVPNLSILPLEASEILLRGTQVRGILTKDGIEIECRALVSCLLDFKPPRGEERGTRPQWG
jgi:tRNA uridine 5-carboxymethylaminomethyl modification enzyme